jgi:hypothetical protein
MDSWALPGSALRLTDPHLASYFRSVITSGRANSVDIFDVTSHLLARSTVILATSSTLRFHVDIRGVGGQQSILLGSDQIHPILSWHFASRTAQLAMPGEAVVELRAVELDTLLRLHLPISDIATLSIWLHDAADLVGVLENLRPFLTDETKALIRLPGSALTGLMQILPDLPGQAVALLPCEPEVDDPTNKLPDIVFCLGSLGSRARNAMVQPQNADHLTMQAEIWRRGQALSPDQGLQVSAIADSRAASLGVPVNLFGDAPSTAVGAVIFGMQRVSTQQSAANGLRFELQAATLWRHNGDCVAVPMAGPAVIDPDIADLALPSPAAMPTQITLTRRQLVHHVESRTTFFLGRLSSRTQFAAQIWPKLELAFELIEREKIAAASICLLFDGEVDDWVRDALAFCGFGPSSLRTEGDGVLFRHLILASPACDQNAMRRGDLFDRFWQRLLGITRGVASEASFIEPRSSGRILLFKASSRLLNSDELVALARTRQYRLIDPDTSSADVLAEALCAAKVIVAQSDAGIWLALAPSAAIGLIQSDTDPTVPYAALHAASARGHQVAVMFGSAIGNAPQASYAVAVDRFALMLDQLEAATTQVGAVA